MPTPVTITPALKAVDLDATIAFYTGELGFTVESLWPREAPTFCILDHGPTHLMFHTEPYEAAEGPPSMTGQLHIGLEAGVMELFERLKDHHEILWGPEVYSYGRREFSIRDPNGYRLVFSEQTNEKPTCEV